MRDLARIIHHTRGVSQARIIHRSLGGELSRQGSRWEPLQVEQSYFASHLRATFAIRLFSGALSQLTARRPPIEGNPRWLFAFTNAFTVIATLACQVPIESRLSEKQANEVLVALNAASIAANKVPERRSDGRTPVFSVEVASSNAGRALSVLQDAELPKRPAPGWNEIFSKTGIIPTAAEERARFTAALSGELSRTIEAMPDVVNARVHIAIPDNRISLLDSPVVRPRASVVVKRRAKSTGGKRLDREKAIKKLIAGAVQNMINEDVSVIEVASAVRSQTPPVLVQVGPMTVTRESVGSLRVIAGTLLVSLLVLTIGVIALYARLRRLSQEMK